MAATNKITIPRKTIIKKIQVFRRACLEAIRLARIMAEEADDMLRLLKPGGRRK